MHVSGFMSSFRNGTKLEAVITNKKLEDVFVAPQPTSAQRKGVGRVDRPH